MTKYHLTINGYRVDVPEYMILHPIVSEDQHVPVGDCAYRTEAQQAAYDIGRNTLIPAAAELRAIAEEINGSSIREIDETDILERTVDRLRAIADRLQSPD